MTTAQLEQPGIYFATAASKAGPSPLRSDVAGFAGRTVRGPIGEAIRVEGWREYTLTFGGVRENADTPHAVRGYFENGGEVAYVIRLADKATAKTATIRDAKVENKSVHSTMHWSPVDSNSNPVLPASSGFLASSYVVRASSPGAWANGTEVSIQYRAQGIANKSELDITIKTPNEAPEYFTGLTPGTFAEQITGSSVLLQFIPNGQVPDLFINTPGPLRFRWDFVLDDGSDGKPLELVDYLDAAVKLSDQPELALLALPDLHRDLPDNDDRAMEVIEALAQQAEQLHDRLVVLDIPLKRENFTATLQWIEGVRESIRKKSNYHALKNLVVYHPHLLVPNPTGGISNPLRSIPPSGHVAGLISRLDRERGAHYTPANSSLLGVVDLTQSLTEGEQALLNDGGINLLRCFPGRGMQVWGGRTLSVEPATRYATFTPIYIAHRRLIHRLVRAIRRVTEPLVFDTNGPELWLTLVRGITTVLLEAFAAGGLKGNRPDEAFRVRCDETTNPPEFRDQGMVVCEIELAPAVPMEFIILRIAMSTTGELEVFEP